MDVACGARSVRGPPRRARRGASATRSRCPQRLPLLASPGPSRRAGWSSQAPQDVREGQKLRELDGHDDKEGAGLHRELLVQLGREREEALRDGRDEPVQRVPLLPVQRARRKHSRGHSRERRGGGGAADGAGRWMERRRKRREGGGGGRGERMCGTKSPAGRNAAGQSPRQVSVHGLQADCRRTASGDPLVARFTSLTSRERIQPASASAVTMRPQPRDNPPSSHTDLPNPNQPFPSLRLQLSARRQTRAPRRAARPQPPC